MGLLYVCRMLSCDTRFQYKIDRETVGSRVISSAGLYRVRVSHSEGCPGPCNPGMVFGLCMCYISLYIARVSVSPCLVAWDIHGLSGTFLFLVDFALFG